MKKLLYLLALVFALTGCQKDEPANKKEFKIDPNATILIKPNSTGWRKVNQLKSSSSQHLSALEIVQQAIGIDWYWTEGKVNLGSGFNNDQRDLEIPALKMFSSNIINLDAYSQPYYVPDFIEGKNCVIVRVIDDVKDTIAYVPNAVLRVAQPLIKEAYDNGDAETVYQLFNEAFTFLPITGAEWRALEQ